MLTSNHFLTWKCLLTSKHFLTSKSVWRQKLFWRQRLIWCWTKEMERNSLHEMRQAIRHLRSLAAQILWTQYRQHNCRLQKYLPFYHRYSPSSLVPIEQSRSGHSFLSTLPRSSDNSFGSLWLQTCTWNNVLWKWTDILLSYNVNQWRWTAYDVIEQEDNTSQPITLHTHEKASLFEVRVLCMSCKP